MQQPTLPEMTKTRKQFVLDDGKARLCQDVPKLVAPSQQLCYAHATYPKNPLPTFVIANHLWLFSLTQPLPFRPTRFATSKFLNPFTQFPTFAQLPFLPAQRYLVGQ